jgi:dethiobiotin synthetase
MMPLLKPLPLRPNTTHFITGTDTGVGKTVVTGWLAAQAAQQGHTVAIYKPIQTGSVALDKPDDPCTLYDSLTAMGHAVTPPALWSSVTRSVTTPGTINLGYTYNFLPPVAPSVADVDRGINPALIASIARQLAKQVDVLLIEGAGGLLVPLTPTVDTRMLIQQLGCPVVLVARPDLGTINHTRLTLEALGSIPLQALIISNYPIHTQALAVQSLPEQLTQWLPPGVVPHYLGHITPTALMPEPTPANNRGLSLSGV